MAKAAGTDKRWVGFDLGGTKMLADVFDKDFNVLGSERRKTKANKGVAFGLERMIETIEAALRQAEVRKGCLAGIGVGCPGPLDLDKGVILDSPNLGWGKVPLKRALERRFGCSVVVANDVDAGAYGEYCFGAAKAARCVVGIFPGTGIGGACVYEGRLVRGKVHSCMEIGHMSVAPGGSLCGCGRRGCLETVASRLAIAAEAVLAASRGQAPHLLELAGTDIENVRSGVIGEAIRAGDRVVEEIVRNAARQIGVATGSVINLLAPDVVVLGGGLVAEMPRIFIDEVRAAARDSAMRALGKSVRFVAAKLGDHAATMGAAALVAGR